MYIRSSFVACFNKLSLISYIKTITFDHIPQVSLSTSIIHKRRLFTLATLCHCKTIQPTMADPSLYTYPSPLEGYETSTPLSEYHSQKRPNIPKHAPNTQSASELHPAPTQKPTSTPNQPPNPLRTPPSHHPSPTTPVAGSISISTSNKPRPRKRSTPKNCTSASGGSSPNCAFILCSRDPSVRTRSACSK